MSDAFVPEADRLEQNTPVADDDDEERGPASPLVDREADEADVLDQAREVPWGEDE